MRGREPLKNMHLHERGTAVQLLICRRKTGSTVRDKTLAIFSPKLLSTEFITMLHSLLHFLSNLLELFMGVKYQKVEIRYTIFTFLSQWCPNIDLVSSQELPL